jgi:hypothetical protein
MTDVQEIDAETATAIYKVVQDALIAAQQSMKDDDAWDGEVDGNLSLDFMEKYKEYYGTDIVDYLRVATKRGVDEIVSELKSKK